MRMRSVVSKLATAGMTILLPLFFAVAAQAAAAIPCDPGIEPEQAVETARPAESPERPCADRAEDCCGMHRGQQARRGNAGQASHHDNIHALLDNHQAISRSVKEIEGGVETITTSCDPKVTETIRLHVRQMQQRVESGHGMRHWDPLFVELFRHHNQIRMVIEDVDGGVLVRETSDDPDVVALIRQHAVRGVSEFADQGFARAHQATPLPEGYPGESLVAEEGDRPPCMR